MSNDYNYPVYLAKGKVLDIKYQENERLVRAFE